MNIHIDSKRGNEKVNAIGRKFIGNNANTQSRLGNNSRNNIDYKGEKSWSEYIVEILERQQSKRLDSKYNS